MKHPSERYGNLLTQLHSHLARYGEPHWTPTLEKWIAESKQIADAQTPISGYAPHLSRTRQSFGGMGSLNDISITPQAGYKISDWRARRVNGKLRRLRTDLFNETERLLRL